MATRTQKRTKQSPVQKQEPVKRYVVVHRNSDDAVLQTSDPFTNEAEAGGHTEHLLRRINFFAGDKLCVEDEARQSEEASNE